VTGYEEVAEGLHDRLCPFLEDAKVAIAERHRTYTEEYGSVEKYAAADLHFRVLATMGTFDA